jgi:radical SAM superfamily enzyme YgiQ (UPF0313 family)
MGRIRSSDVGVQRKRLAREVGTIRKDWGGRLPIALCYPNSYAVGMCNLGFQSVYSLFNSARDFVCERVFAEPVLIGSGSAGRGDWTGDEKYRLERLEALGEPLSVESQRPLTDFSVVAFSLSFELDYFNVGDVLRRAGIAPLASERHETDPIVIAGGPAVSGNPEPLAPILDAIVIGEVEPVMDGLQDVLLGGGSRAEQIEKLARLPGVYVPAQYAISYSSTGTIEQVRPASADLALPVARLNARNVNDFQTMSAVLSPDIELGDMFLLEMTRGCARGCRFCLAGYTSLPVRHRNVDHLMHGVEHGLEMRKRIGLISAATSDHPQLEQLLERMLDRGAEVSLSSLRIDRISPFLVEALVRSGTKTITLAPEAGSQRLRDVINKRLTHEQIVQAAELAGRGGIPKAKLYFIVGLPGETDDDVRELAALSHEVLCRMREHNRGARVAVNLSPHVPKAQTAFQWESMADVETSDRRIKLVQRALGPLGIDVRFEAPAAQRVQAILARGDRRLAPVLLQTQRLQQFEANLKQQGLDPNFYLGAMDPNGFMPWALVSTGVPEWYLRQEFGRARGIGGQEVPQLDLPPKAAALVETARRNGAAA